MAIERPGQLIPMRVRVRGTAEIDKAHIIRDGSIVRAQRPGMQETDFQFGDTASGESGRSRYSYVRTEQAGGQAA